MAEQTPPGELVRLTVTGGEQVAGRWLAPEGARACYVLAHGAGAGMEHPFMRSTAVQLGALGIATLRYQFPYLQRGSKRPDPPPVCHATVRAAVAEAQRRAPAAALFAGGRSFGGRMSSQAQALEPLPRVRGVVFLGFPLHPAGRPGIERAAHLAAVSLPMLFVQGRRDALAEAALLEQVLQQLAPRASAHWIDGADHSFHVPARSGRKDADVLRELIGAAADWMSARS
jgi:predicted alpha/beta-hydrolase family hydrolase